MRVCEAMGSLGPRPESGAGRYDRILCGAG